MIEAQLWLQAQRLTRVCHHTAAILQGLHFIQIASLGGGRVSQNGRIYDSIKLWQLTRPMSTSGTHAHVMQVRGSCPDTLLQLPASLRELSLDSGFRDRWHSGYRPVPTLPSLLANPLHLNLTTVTCFAPQPIHAFDLSLTLAVAFSVVRCSEPRLYPHLYPDGVPARVHDPARDPDADP